MQTFCSCCTFFELSMYHSTRGRSETGTENKKKGKTCNVSGVCNTHCANHLVFTLSLPPDPTTSFCSLPAINRGPFPEHGGPPFSQDTTPEGQGQRRVILPREASVMPTKHLYHGQYAVTVSTLAPGQDTRTTSLILTKQEAADASYLVLV